MTDLAKTRKVLESILLHQFSNKLHFYIEDDLVKDHQADELDIVEITMELEDELDIDISDKEKDKWETVGDILKCVCNKLKIKEIEPIIIVEPINSRFEILDL
jgi:acyl carrier protein